MKSIVFAILACATAFGAQAETENFDSTSPGALPEGWEAGVTGSGNPRWAVGADPTARSEEHTSELQSQSNLVCRLLLEKKKNVTINLCLIAAYCCDKSTSALTD